MKKIFKKGLTNEKVCCIIGTSISFFGYRDNYSLFISKDDTDLDSVYLLSAEFIQHRID